MARLPSLAARRLLNDDLVVDVVIVIDVVDLVVVWQGPPQNF
jgi:hypothetical protein